MIASGTSLHGLNLFIKEVKGGVVHYNYLCNLSDPVCVCPEGETCAIGMSDSEYREMVRYGLMQEVDTFCEYVGDDITVSSPDGDTSYSLNTDWICTIGIGYGCPGCPYPGGGGGGGDRTGDGCFGCDSIPDQTPPRCLDTTLWEHRYYIPGFYNDYVGLYFGANESRVDLSKPVVLLVHGLNGTCERWEDNYAPWLKHRGYRVASVDLFSVNSVVPPDYYGGGFYPNTKLLDTLVRMLYNYITSTYSSGNRNIVVIAHSRGGLEAEGILLLKRNPYVTKVITIGTPFYGSSLADICMNFENAFQCGRLDILCNTVKSVLKSLGIEVISACNILVDGARLSHVGVETWRMTLGASGDIPFNVGIGWNDDMLCSGFSLSNRIGCLLIRYFATSGCNDGAVEYTSTRRRESYPNTHLISTRPDVSSDVRCSGDPREWKKDHSASASDYTIFDHYIRPSIGSGFFAYSRTTGGTMRNGDLMSYMSEPVVYRSNALLTVVPYSAMRMLHVTNTVLAVSPSPLDIMGADRVDTVDMESRYAYKVIPGVSGLQIMIRQEMGGGSEEITSVESTPLMLFYLNGSPSVMWLPRRGVFVDEPVEVKLYHPSADEAHLIVWKYRDSSYTAQTFNFTEVGDTFTTTISVHEPGIYNLMAWTTGANPKTIMGLLYVFSSSDEDEITSLVLGGPIPGVERRGVGSTPDGSERSHPEGDFLVVERERGVYKIYSPSGSLVRYGKFQNGRVPIHDLPRGVYFVVIEGKVYKILR